MEPVRQTKVRRLQAPVSLHVEDPALERVRRNHDERIRELQAQPIVGGKLVKDIELPDGSDVFVSHGFGRVAYFFLSPPRYTHAATTGRIHDRRLGNFAEYDPRNSLCLRANGWGGTIYVDAWLF